MSKLIGKHGGYKKFLSYQMAVLVYDITVRFCDKYIDRFSRTKEQMIQAARSGAQNIAEGSQDSATSKKLELKLTQVAIGSLEELKNDYITFLRQKSLPQWDNTDTRWKLLIDRKCRTADDVSDWIKDKCDEMATADKPACGYYEEYSANACIILCQVACSLLNKQVQRLAKDFEENGGFTEKMYHVRKDKLGK